MLAESKKVLEGKPTSKELKDQQQWASEAMDLFARLFNGATGFVNLLGSWYDRDSETVLLDKPIMIQTLAPRETITEANVKRVLEFGRRMGRRTNQACIGVVVNDVFYEVIDFGIE